MPDVKNSKGDAPQEGRDDPNIDRPDRKANEIGEPSKAPKMDEPADKPIPAPSYGDDGGQAGEGDESGHS